MNILELLEEKGLSPKRVGSNRGGEYKSPCPKCGDGKDRFVCHPEDGEHGGGTAWCRQCGWRGDLVQFLVDFCNMDYPAAFRAAGREMPSDYVRQPAWKKKKYNSAKSFSPNTVGFDASVDVPTWQAHVGKFVDWCHSQLLKTPDQIRYLAGRGIPINAIKKYHLGFNPGENGKAVFRPRESWGLPTITKKDPKTGDERPKKLWIPRGIVIPWFVNGEICRVKIRRVNEDVTENFDLRYYALPGSNMVPMLINPDRQAFVVEETELDAIMIDDLAGDLVGILALGTVSAKPDTVAFKALKKSKCILNALDHDEAGAKARAWWDDNFSQAKRWPVLVGKDPGDAFKAGVDIREWIAAGLPPVMTLRPSSFVSKTQGGAENTSIDAGPAEVQQSEKESPLDGLTEPCRRLYDLLQLFPIKIACSREHTGILNRDDILNQNALDDVADLIFDHKDLSVLRFLEAHPDDVVTKYNFLKGVK